MSKILCVSVSKHWGGGEEFLLNLNNSITGHHFSIMTPPGESCNNFSDYSLRVIESSALKKIERANSGWKTFQIFKILLSIVSSSIDIVKNINQTNADIILANGNYAGLLSIIPQIITEKKLIVIQHLIYNNRTFEKVVIKILNRVSTKIVCVSNSVYQNMKVMLGKSFSDDKFMVIYNGYALPEECSSVHKSTEEILRFGIIGSIKRIKGIDLLIEAFRNVLKSHSRISLHIYGTAPNDFDSQRYFLELQEMVKSYSLSDRIIFEGFVKLKHKIYLNLDFVINYSKIPESFALSVLEGMFYKKIVIAADIGGPGELIENGVNGFLIQPQNVKELEKIMLDCISNFNSERMNLIREKAFSDASEKFNLKRFSENYQKLFDDILITT